MTKRIVAVVSEKGGVGKTMASGALLDYLRSSGVTVSAYDADGGVGGLLRVYGARDPETGVVLSTQNPETGVGYYNVRSDDERNTFLDAMASLADLFFHDMAGGSAADIMRIVDSGDGIETLLDAIAEHGYRLTLIHMITAEIATAQSVRKWLTLTGDRADHIAMRNTRWGNRDCDFPYWHGFRSAAGKNMGGKVRADFIAAGGVEIDLPAIPAGTHAKIDAESMSLSAAAESSSDNFLTISERTHVVGFRRQFAKNVQPALKFILPEN